MLLVCMIDAAGSETVQVIAQVHFKLRAARAEGKCRAALLGLFSRRYLRRYSKSYLLGVMLRRSYGTYMRIMCDLDVTYE